MYSPQSSLIRAWKITPFKEKGVNIGFAKDSFTVQVITNFVSMWRIFWIEYEDLKHYVYKHTFHNISLAKAYLQDFLKDRLQMSEARITLANGPDEDEGDSD